MNLKKLAGKFPSGECMITSMASMAVRKTHLSKSHSFEAKIIYSRHFQVDLPFHDIPPGIGPQHSSMLGDSADRRITNTICLEAKCTS